MRRLVPLLLAGCALGGGSGGGDEALPVSGAGPYAKLEDFNGKTPLFEPFVVTDPLASIGDPAPILLADGSYRVFYARGAELWRADVPGSLRELAGEPVLVLTGGGDDGPRVGAPSVIHLGGALVLYYQTDAGVARATSTDGGASFTRDGLVLAGAAAPGAVAAAGQVFLYHTIPGDPAIHVATAPGGAGGGKTFTTWPEPALAPHAPGDLHSWDVQGLGDPSAVAGADDGVTAAGELHVGLFYTGKSADGTIAIGHAGSADGLHFAAELAPVLEPRSPNETGPAVILFPTRAVLFFTENRSGKLAIGVATDPRTP